MFRHMLHGGLRNGLICYASTISVISTLQLRSNDNNRPPVCYTGPDSTESTSHLYGVNACALQDLPHTTATSAQKVCSQYIDVYRFMPTQPTSANLWVLLDPPSSRGKLLAELENGG